MVDPSRKTFNNSRPGPLEVPGFNGIPVYYELPLELRFSNGARACRPEWHQDPRLTLREIGMIRTMNAITDKPGWHHDVFNDDITTGWKTEALVASYDRDRDDFFMSERAWQWCLAELRDKATFFMTHQYVLALDSGCRVAKSDSLVPREIAFQLAEGASQLLEATTRATPGSEDVRDLVDPTLYPLVYDETKVLNSRYPNTLDDFLAFCGHGEVAKGYDRAQMAQEQQNNLQQRLGYPRHWRGSFLSDYQRLPCDLQFTGAAPHDVRITSYINNLHPVRCRGMYSAIERVLALTIGLWDSVLIKSAKPRSPPRIRTYSGQTEPDFPDCFKGLEARDDWEQAYPGMRKKVEEYLSLPDKNPQFLDRTQHSPVSRIPCDIENWGFPTVIHAKWARLRHVVHPEPGLSFSYDDWKAGRTGKPLMPLARRSPKQDHACKLIPDSSDEGQSPNHEFYDVSLQETFRKDGLQVIIRITSHELSPDRPQLSGVQWNISGTLTEHVAAVAIYCFDEENVVGGDLDFRQQSTLGGLGPYEHLYKDYSIVREVFGINDRGIRSFQELGTVTLHSGRLVAFPNSLSWKMNGLRLMDSARSGHLRYLVMELIDPHYRICSTRNVPPQQHDWWAEEALAQIDWARTKLPQELIDQIVEDVGEYGLTGATQHRERFRKALASMYEMDGVGERFRI